MDASGSNRNWEKDQPSISPSPLDGAKVQERHHILLVEDSKADLFLMREAITGAEVQADLHVVSDGESAIRFIDAADTDESAPCPALILLDLNLPKKTGVEVLQHIRRSRKCCDTLILIITSSDSQNDKKATTELGVNGYFRKPSSYEAFSKIGEIVKNLLTTPPGTPVPAEPQ